MRCVINDSRGDTRPPTGLVDISNCSCFSIKTASCHLAFCRDRGNVEERATLFLRVRNSGGADAIREPVPSAGVHAWARARHPYDGRLRSGDLDGRRCPGHRLAGDIPSNPSVNKAAGGIEIRDEEAISGTGLTKLTVTVESSPSNES
jgi:hypothetical protein